MSTLVWHYYLTVSSQSNTYPLFSLSSSEVPTSSTTDPPVAYKQLDHTPSVEVELIPLYLKPPLCQVQVEEILKYNLL